MVMAKSETIHFTGGRTFLYGLSVMAILMGIFMVSCAFFPSSNDVGKSCQRHRVDSNPPSLTRSHCSSGANNEHDDYDYDDDIVAASRLYKQCQALSRCPASACGHRLTTYSQINPTMVVQEESHTKLPCGNVSTPYASADSREVLQTYSISAEIPTYPSFPSAINMGQHRSLHPSPIAEGPKPPPSPYSPGRSKEFFAIQIDKGRPELTPPPPAYESISDTLAVSEATGGGRSFAEELSEYQQPPPPYVPYAEEPPPYSS